MLIKIAELNIDANKEHKHTRLQRDIDIELAEIKIRIRGLEKCWK